jgi:hypothetical protein
MHLLCLLHLHSLQSILTVNLEQVCVCSYVHLIKTVITCAGVDSGPSVLDPSVQVGASSSVPDADFGTAVDDDPQTADTPA